MNPHPLLITSCEAALFQRTTGSTARMIYCGSVQRCINQSVFLLLKGIVSGISVTFYITLG